MNGYDLDKVVGDMIGDRCYNCGSDAEPGGFTAEGFQLCQSCAGKVPGALAFTILEFPAEAFAGAIADDPSGVVRLADVFLVELGASGELDEVTDDPRDSADAHDIERWRKVRIPPYEKAFGGDRSPTIFPLAGVVGFFDETDFVDFPSK